MLGEWLEQIKAMGIFLICAQMLIHFRPKGTYAKYLRLLVSIMLLVQLLELVGRLIGVLEAGEFQHYVREMERKLGQMQGQTFSMEKETEDIWKKLLGEE